MQLVCLVEFELVKDYNKMFYLFMCCLLNVPYVFKFKYLYVRKNKTLFKSFILNQLIFPIKKKPSPYNSNKNGVTQSSL